MMMVQDSGSVDERELAAAGRRSRLPELVLVLVALIWGSTFIVSQVMLRESGPFAVLAIRFLVGAVALLVAFAARMRGTTRTEVRTGVAIGVVTFASYAFQVVGLEHIASSRSAFITSMYVPLVPLLQLALLRQAPRVAAWVGIGVSFTGLVLLSAGEGLTLALSFGDRLTLAGAAMAALQIVLLSRWVRAADPMRLAFVQLATVAGLALAAMPLVGEAMPPLGPGVLGGGLFLGLLGTAFALGAMSWAQQTVSATRATVIYSMEPVWAGVIGALAGEAMTHATVGGSTLIVLGVLVSEARWRSRPAPAASALCAARE